MLTRARAAAVLLAALLPSVASAEPKEVTSGEFRNTAHTIEKGEFVLHPLFMPSGYGLTDNIDLKFGILSTIGGPNASLELNLVDNDSIAVSVEPLFAMAWNPSNRLSVGADARFTKLLGDNRFNLSLGGALNRGQITVYDENGDVLSSTAYNSVGVPVNIGFDLVSSDTTTWRFVGTTDVGSLASGTTYGIVGANWNKGLGNTFRLSLGVAAYIGENPFEGIAVIEDILPSGNVLPLPTIELWWKL